MRARDNLGDLYLLMADQAYARAAAIREAERATGGPATEDSILPRADAELTATAAPRAAAKDAAAPVTDASAAALEQTKTDRRQPSPVFALVDRREALAAVERWRAAWSTQDVNGYLGAYVNG